MKKLDDKLILRVQGGTMAAIGALWFPEVVNKKCAELMFTETMALPEAQACALVKASLGAAILVGAEGDAKTRKRMLKLNGVGWLSAAGLNLYHGFVTKKEKQAFAIGQAAVTAGLGTLGLIAGFQKDDEEKKTTKDDGKKKSTK